MITNAQLDQIAIHCLMLMGKENITQEEMDLPRSLLLVVEEVKASRVMTEFYAKKLSWVASGPIGACKAIDHSDHEPYSAFSLYGGKRARAHKAKFFPEGDV